MKTNQIVGVMTLVLVFLVLGGLEIPGAVLGKEKILFLVGLMAMGIFAFNFPKVFKNLEKVKHELTKPENPQRTRIIRPGEHRR